MKPGQKGSDQERHWKRGGGQQEGRKEFWDGGYRERSRMKEKGKIGEESRKRWGSGEGKRQVGKEMHNSKQEGKMERREELGER